MFKILTKRILTCLFKKKDGLLSILVQNSPKGTKKVLDFRKVARSCSLTKKLLKILKVATKLPSRIWKGLPLIPPSGSSPIIWLTALQQFLSMHSRPSGHLPKNWRGNPPWVCTQPRLKSARLPVLLKKPGYQESSASRWVYKHDVRYSSWTSCANSLSFSLTLAIFWQDDSWRSSWKAAWSQGKKSTAEKLRHYLR